MLFLTLCLQVGYNSASKKLSVDVGGAKRLHALSTLIQSLFLGPWALIVSSTSETQVRHPNKTQSEDQKISCIRVVCLITWLTNY